MKNLVRAGAAALAAAALVLAPTAAYADVVTPPAPLTLEQAKAAVTTRIDNRLTTLTRLTTQVNASPTVTPAHKTALLDLFVADTAGLTALKAKVALDTTPAEVDADRTSMFVDYRIYLVVVPKTHIVLRADYLAARAAGVVTATTKATRSTNRAADRWLKRTAVDLTKAAAHATAAADAALAVTPATMLKGGKSFATARAHLAAARYFLGLGKGHLHKAHKADRRHAGKCPKLRAIPTVPTVAFPTAETA